MKPANFPQRKLLRQARAKCATAGLFIPPRGFDHGAVATFDERSALPEVK